MKVSRDVIEILMIEDNPGDIRLTQEALRDAKMNVNMSVLMDGISALAFLNHQGAYENAPEPDLILLDLNLPLKSGFEILEEIKQNEHLRQIPVVVLTSSQAERDIVKSYNLHANAYVTKPVDLDQFISVVKGIEDFWFEIVKLPKNNQH